MLAWLFSFTSMMLAIILAAPTVLVLSEISIRYAVAQLESYPNRLKGWRDYRQKYSTLTQDYERKKADDRESYQKALGEHEQACDRIRSEELSPSKIKTHQNLLVLKELEKTVPPGEEVSNTSIGWCERTFLGCLMQYFPDNVCTESTLSIPDFDYPYSPDIAYIDKTTNLHIDIEVDEPYIYHSKEPYHYIGKDDRRNNFFLDCGWLVIRFSEEQVACYPESCCKAVAQAIAEVTGDDEIMRQFEDVLDLTPIPQWTEEEAHIMAIENYRDEYLDKSSPRKLERIK